MPDAEAPEAPGSPRFRLFSADTWGAPDTEAPGSPKFRPFSAGTGARWETDELQGGYAEAAMPGKGEKYEEEPRFWIFQAKMRWWVGLANFILNKIAGFFWSSMFGGWLDWLTVWVPMLERSATMDFFAQIRIDGKKLKFAPPAGQWVCRWFKLKFLNFISFGLYGMCCGANKKHMQYCDSHCTLDGHEGETKYWTAQPPGWAALIYVLGNLTIGFLGMRPFMILWYKKRECANMQFSGVTIRLKDTSYCEFAKIYYCKCGIFCSAKLNQYYDEHLEVGGASILGDMKGMGMKAMQKLKGPEAVEQEDDKKN